MVEHANRAAAVEERIAPEQPPLRVLLVTTEYPTPERPGGGAYLVRHVAALREAGVDVEVLFFRSRLNPLNHFRAWRELRRRLADRSFDLVHAHFGHAALICRLQRRLPVVVTYHGSDVLGVVGRDGRYSWKGRLQGLLSGALSRGADEVIVVADHIGRRLPMQGYSVIPLGIDLERFQPMDQGEARRALGWPEEGRIVMFASLDLGNPVKRYPLAQQAVEIASRTMLVELRAASGVRPDEMPLYLNAADALVLTSIHEGSPTVVKEAMACGLPVVTTDVGDVRERLSGVMPRAICAPDPESLAAGLLDVLHDARRSNGREAAQQLAEPLVAERVIEVYRRATSGSRGC